MQEWWEGEDRDPRLLAASGYLLGYPFADRLYAEALEVLAHLHALGPTVVLTDGDAVFQPHKVERAGIASVIVAIVLGSSSKTSSGATRPRATCSSTTSCASSPPRERSGKSA